MDCRWAVSWCKQDEVRSSQDDCEEGGSIRSSYRLPPHLHPDLWRDAQERGGKPLRGILQRRQIELRPAHIMSANDFDDYVYCRCRLLVAYFVMTTHITLFQASKVVRKDHNPATLRCRPDARRSSRAHRSVARTTIELRRVGVSI
jgi:hypothetical protein